MKERKLVLLHQLPIDEFLDYLKIMSQITLQELRDRNLEDLRNFRDKMMAYFELVFMISERCARYHPELKRVYNQIKDAIALHEMNTENVRVN